MALGIMMSSIWTDGWSAIEDIWIYPVMPFVGSLLALVFFEFVYKKTQEALDHDEEIHNDGEG